VYNADHYSTAESPEDIDRDRLFLLALPQLTAYDFDLPLIPQIARLTRKHNGGYNLSGINAQTGYAVFRGGCSPCYNDYGKFAGIIKAAPAVFNRRAADRNINNHAAAQSIPVFLCLAEQAVLTAPQAFPGTTYLPEPNHF